MRRENCFDETLLPNLAFIFAALPLMEINTLTVSFQLSFLQEQTQETKHEVFTNFSRTIFPIICMHNTLLEGSTTKIMQSRRATREKCIIVHEFLFLFSILFFVLAAPCRVILAFPRFLWAYSENASCDKSHSRDRLVNSNIPLITSQH